MLNENSINASEDKGNLTILDGFYTPEKPLTPAGYLATGVYLCFVGTIATLGNIFVIVTIVKTNPMRRKPQLLLHLNLAVADLAVSVFGYPYVAVAGFYGRWMIGYGGCVMFAFLCFTFSMVSMNSLVVISVYRYIILAKPEYKSKINHRNTYICLACTWIFAISWTILPLLGWSKYTYEPFGTSCSMNWQGTDWEDITYMVATCITCYAVHVAIISFCYFKMCLVMVLCFLVVWTPYAVVSVWIAFFHDLPAWLVTFPTMFAKGSCALNPIVYTAMNSSFRKQMTKLFLHCAIKVEPEDHAFVRNKRPHKTADPKIFCVSYTKDGVYIGKDDGVERGLNDRVPTAWASQSNLQHSISLPDLRTKGVPKTEHEHGSDQGGQNVSETKVKDFICESESDSFSRKSSWQCSSNNSKETELTYETRSFTNLEDISVHLSSSSTADRKVDFLKKKNSLRRFKAYLDKYKEGNCGLKKF